LTFALDVFTGYPFGCYVGFEPPSYHTVQLCLLHGILPKPDCPTLYGTKNNWPVYGLPEILVTDNGKEFLGQDLSEACAQLGIELYHTPVRKPWFKGSVERYFRTLNTGLVHPLPGTTYSNIMERGDYNPTTQACISLASFWKLLHIFILDIYAQRWHSGLEATPAKRWQAGLMSGFKPTLSYSAPELRILLLRATERTIQRSGIDFETLRYQCPELARLRNSTGKVRLKYDPADLSVIYVADPVSANGWLKVPAVDQVYTKGLSIWKHQLIRQYVLREKREVNIYELAAAKQLIQQIAAAEFTQTRQQRGRKTAARVLGIGADLTPEAVLAEKSSTIPASNEKAVPTPVSPKELATITEEEFLIGPRWGGDYNLPRDRPALPR
jgi:putative transposase